MEFLHSLTPYPHKREVMIHVKQNKAFKKFPCSGKVEVVDKLIVFTLPQNRQTMYNEGISEALEEAVKINNLEMIEVTLSFAPDKWYITPLKSVPLYTQNDNNELYTLFNSQPFFDSVVRRKKLFNLGYFHTQISASSVYDSVFQKRVNSQDKLIHHIEEKTESMGR